MNDRRQHRFLPATAHAPSGLIVADARRLITAAFGPPPEAAVKPVTRLAYQYGYIADRRGKAA